MMMKASVSLSAIRFCLAILLLVSAGDGAARAQDARAAAARLDKYERLASESIEVTLDEPLLRLAAAALSEGDAGQRKAKELARQLQGVYVRTLEFEREGAYDAAEVEALRAPFRGPGWSRVAGVKSERYEHVELYVSRDGSIIRGLTVLAAGPRSLAFINLSGSIRPERIADLEGRFAIPRLGLRVGAKE
jgi:hypothetical protein